MSTRSDILDRAADLRAEPGVIERLRAVEGTRVVVVRDRRLRVADRAVQMCGGLGTTHELPVAKIAREVRPFRIYDGPTEVHRWSLARRAVREIAR